MVNTNKLRGIMAERGVTRTEMAGTLGITPNTFRRKMAKGIFTSAEMSVLIEALDITDPTSIFFAELVSQ